MKQKLNTRALGHSKNEKHQKIYRKVRKLQLAQHEVAEWSENDVKENAERFEGLKIKMVAGGDIVIESKKDSWRLCDEITFIALYHKGMEIQKGRIIEKWHVQDVFEDLSFALASIISHDNYKIHGAHFNASVDPNEIMELVYCQVYLEQNS